MKCVVDSSVALKWVLPEPESGTALRLRDEYNKGLHDLLAPDLFAPEVANGLASAERQKRVKSGESALLLIDIVRTAPAIYPSQFLLVRAMEIAVATRHAVYDCVYLALAEAEACELVTSDDKLVKTLRKQFPFIVDLKNLP